MARRPTYAQLAGGIPRLRTSSPHAWDLIDADVSFPEDVPNALNTPAAALLTELIAAAKAIEPSLSAAPHEESPARIQWRSDLNSLATIVARVDSGATTATDDSALRERIAAAILTATDGQAVALRALRVPGDPDRAFRQALEACAAFFGGD
jgi:hypothetical protein